MGQRFCWAIFVLCAVGCGTDRASDNKGSTDAGDRPAMSSGTPSTGSSTASVPSVVGGMGGVGGVGGVGVVSDRDGAAINPTANDAGSSAQPDDAATGAPTPEGVPMFVAQGHVGRTLVSCDDGQSWVANRSFDTEGDAYVCDSTEPVRCFTDGQGCIYLDNGACQPKAQSCDCDHHPGAANGIAYGNGYWVASWGWGPKGSVRRSNNGVDWEIVVMDTTFGGVAFGSDTFLLGRRDPMLSSNAGATFGPGGNADLREPGAGGDETIYNVRALGFVDVRGGRFVITGEDAQKRDVLVSSDSGASFVRPSVLPAECGAGALSVVGGDGVIAILHRSGQVCYSTDGGDSFALSNTGGALEGDALFANGTFMAWGNGTRYTSPDAITWTSATTTPANLLIGPVAHDPTTGTFVAIRGGWQTWYAGQAFYRSADGLGWTVLDKSAIAATDAQNHPMRHIAFGYGAASASCPKR